MAWKERKVLQDQSKHLESDMLGKRNPVNRSKTALQLNKVKGTLQTASGFQTQILSN